MNRHFMFGTDQAIMLLFTHGHARDVSGIADRRRNDAISGLSVLFNPHDAARRIGFFSFQYRF